jgi:hypothetical protein
VGKCDGYSQYWEHGRCWEHSERTFSAGDDNEMSLVKKTDSTRISWSVPNEDGFLDQTIETTSEHPRVLLGSKRSENPASSIMSVVAAATTSAWRTFTASYASTSRSTRRFDMSNEGSPRPPSADCQARHR